MRRTPTRGLLVVACSLLFLHAAPAARAAGPIVQGWWTVTTPGGGAVPVPVPVPPPAPPDVPADGLLVQGAGETPVAVAALRYEVPNGATAASLVLAVAEGSASTPTASLRVCPLLSTGFTPAKGGPMADAPPFDCTRAVSAVAEPTTSTYRFDVAPLVSGTSLAVALVGSASSDRVVLAAPGADSLAVSGGSAPSTTPPATTPATGSATGAGGGATPTGGATGSVVRLPIAPGVAIPAPAASAAAPAAARPAAPVAPAFAPVFAPSAEEVSLLRAGLVILALAGGATLWAIAGRRRDDEEPDAARRVVGL